MFPDRIPVIIIEVDSRQLYQTHQDLAAIEGALDSPLHARPRSLGHHGLAEQTLPAGEVVGGGQVVVVFGDGDVGAAASLVPLVLDILEGAVFHIIVYR